jgi:hypothetical protein
MREQAKITRNSTRHQEFGNTERQNCTTSITVHRRSFAQDLLRKADKLSANWERQMSTLAAKATTHRLFVAERLLLVIGQIADFFESEQVLAAGQQTAHRGFIGTYSDGIEFLLKRLAG